MSGRRTAVVLTFLLLAGCFGKGGHEPTKSAAVNASLTGPTYALPNGLGTSAAANESAPTVNGTFGVAHAHDYWKGRDKVVLFEKNVVLNLFPILPGGQGSTPKGVGYVTFSNDTLVYEGTDRVSVLAVASSKGPPPVLTMQYRTAADAQWRDPQPLAYGTPFDLKVKPDETDMPHSTSSLWNFRLVSDRPFALDSVNVTITAYRGRDVASWPGHPDLYPDGKTTRVLIDKDVKNHKAGGADVLLYEGGDAWVAPEKLVSYGTGSLDVFVNVTKVDGPPGLSPVSHWIAYHDARSLGYDNWSYVYNETEGRNDLKSYHFFVPVDPAGMDSPYQPFSRWGVRVEAGFGAPDTSNVQGLSCGDCVSYDVTYHLTIVAHKADAPQTLAG